jgi:trimeric autotransporter adhesin
MDICIRLLRVIWGVLAVLTSGHAIACTDQYDTVRANICKGQTYYNVNSGATISVSGVYRDTLFTQVGKCDSIITLIITQDTAYPPRRTEYGYTCNSSGYLFYGLSYQRSGTYYHQEPSPTGGCDSIITLKLSVARPIIVTLNYLICPGDTFFYHGQIYTTDTSLREFTPLAGGCDSTTLINLSVQLPRAPMTTGYICVGHSTFTYLGRSYALPGVYYDTVATSLGCSIVYPITVSTSLPHLSEVSATLCRGGSYTFAGQVLTQAGEYYSTLPSSSGCDSLIHLTLSSAVPTVYVSVGVCDSLFYLFNGHYYTRQGTYYDTVYNASGCDTLYIINLKFTKPSQTINAAICTGDTFLLGQQRLTQSGSYTQVFTTSHGCDSTVYLTLTTRTYVSQVVTGDLCAVGGTFNYRGKSYTTEGSYLDTIGSTSGCDTIVLVSITRRRPTRTVGSIGCAGSYYTYMGHDYPIRYGYTAYSITIPATLGCDTVVIIALQSYPTATVTIRDVLPCRGSSYLYRDSTFTGVGTHYYYAHSPRGCDSVIIIRLTLNRLVSVPSIYLSRYADTLYAYRSGYFSSYAWLYNRAVVAGATQPYISPIPAGTYQLTIVDRYGCSDTSLPYYIKPKPIDSTQTQDSVRIYPNPNQGYYTLHWIPQPASEWAVYNLLGQLVYSSLISQPTELIDMSYVPAGSYIAVIRTAGTVFTKRRLLVVK